MKYHTFATRIISPVVSGFKYIVLRSNRVNILDSLGRIREVGLWRELVFLGSILNVLSLVLVLWILLYPGFTQRRVISSRIRIMRELEESRGTRVITLIHRQESVNLLGIPVARYINIEDSEQILRVIRMTPPEMPIDLILHTPGGLVLATEQIALAIQAHPAPTTVFVPHYAMSGGTMLALAADEIVMDENAVLGPVDPQIESYPAASILQVAKTKPIDKLEDETFILADISRKAIVQVQDSVTSLLRDRMPEEEAARISKLLTEGNWTHDYPLTVKQLQSIGLRAKTGMPWEVYRLMEPDVRVVL